MTEDIVKRLREGTFGTDECKTDRVINSHMSAAADEITRLRADVERLREALENILQNACRTNQSVVAVVNLSWLVEARAVLAETGKE